jgi:hypothetical protein
MKFVTLIICVINRTSMAFMDHGGDEYSDHERQKPAIHGVA